MKKTALTIGLFSLVIVTTSFTTPKLVILPETNNIALGIDGGGVSTREGRKLDVTNPVNQETMKNNQMKSLRSAGQTLDMGKKLD